MPARKRNVWPFSSRKAAPAPRVRSRSSMTVGEATRAAYQAGQAAGDTGLFDAWLTSDGLHSHGNMLRARLRAEYDRGVESLFEPRAEKTRRTVSPADLNREFVDRSKRRGKKGKEPEAERADASAVGIDTGRLRAHLGKGGTLAEYQAGQIRNPRQANRFQLIAAKYFKRAEEQLGAGRIFVETLRKGGSPHAGSYTDGDFYIKIENPTTAHKLHDFLHELAHLTLGHIVKKEDVRSRSEQEVEAELWARNVMQAEGVPISRGIESATRYNMAYVVKEDTRAGRPVDARAVEMSGKGTASNPKYTREELERLPVETLDRMAFGFVSGDERTVTLASLVPVEDDLENAVYQAGRYSGGPKAWARSVDLSEPIRVKLRGGQNRIDDGHHRYYAAKLLGKKTLRAIVEIDDNAIDAILGKRDNPRRGYTAAERALFAMRHTKPEELRHSVTMQGSEAWSGAADHSKDFPTAADAETYAAGLRREYPEASVDVYAHVVRNPDVTDRAKRYRAQGAIMQTKKNCVICGVPGRLPSDPESNKPRLDVMHLTGNESHGETANLAYGCRPCNAKLAAAFKQFGAGRPTKQYNPSKSTIPTFEQYAWAVTQGNREHWVKGVGKVAGGKDEWGAIIHATPKHKRIEYAKRIARKASGTKRAAHEERWNPSEYGRLSGMPREPLPAGVKAYQVDYDKGYAAGFRKGSLPAGSAVAFQDGFNDARRRSKANPDAQLIRQAETARSIEDLARLHKHAISKGDSALLAAVETRAGNLGIRHAELTAAHPRQWQNPRPSNVPKNYEVVSIRNRAEDAADVRAALEAAGIPAVIHEHHLTSTGSPISSPYSVWTPKKTYKRAVKLAEQAYFARHPDRIAPNPRATGFGRIYGDPHSPAYITDSGTPVWMWRKGQRVRFYTADGEQVGPEQSNVGPAVLSASAAGWRDPNLPDWFNRGFTAETRSRSKRRNPEDSAAALYESFHGKPADEELLIEEEVHVHENLSVLGRAVECWIDTPSGLRACVEFDQDVNAEPIMLCSAENGKQLYFEGGDQKIDLKSLQMDGEEWVKDRMVLGQFSAPEPRGAKRRKHNLTYNTRKDFDQFETIDYQHDLGEDSGVRPYLEYDPRNQHLYITGGQYFINQPLLETSPGIEN